MRSDGTEAERSKCSSNYFRVTGELGLFWQCYRSYPQLLRDLIIENVGGKCKIGAVVVVSKSKLRFGDTSTVLLSCPLLIPITQISIAVSNLRSEMAYDKEFGIDKHLMSKKYSCNPRHLQNDCQYRTS